MGLDFDFDIDLEKYAQLPESVVREMAKAGGEVLVKKIKAKGRSMGVYRTGQTVGNVAAKSPTKSGDGISVTVTIKGNRNDRKTKTTNAEVGMINNYGKRGQAARPFFTQGVAESEDESIQAAEKVYDAYIKSIE